MRSLFSFIALLLVARGVPRKARFVARFGRPIAHSSLPGGADPNNGRGGEI